MPVILNEANDERQKRVGNLKKMDRLFMGYNIVKKRNL